MFVGTQSRGGQCDKQAFTPARNSASLVSRHCCTHYGPLILHCYHLRSFFSAVWICRPFLCFVFIGWDEKMESCWAGSSAGVTLWSCVGAMELRQLTPPEDLAHKPLVPLGFCFHELSQGKQVLQRLPVPHEDAPAWH